MKIFYSLSILFLFACSSNSNTEETIITESQIQAVINTELISTMLEQHLLDNEKLEMNPTNENSIKELIALTLQYEKSIETTDMNKFRDLFQIEVEKSKEDNNKDSELGSNVVFEEYMNALDPLMDVAFRDGSKEEKLVNLKELQIYLGNFFRLFKTA